MSLLNFGSQTSSSPSFDSIATPRKTASRNSCKNLWEIQRSDKKLWPFWPVTQICQQDLHVTELWFHTNPKENRFTKLVQKFKRDPMVGWKVMAILTCYSSLDDQTSSSPSCDSIATPRKTASGNSGKTLSAIQWFDKKLWPFWPVTKVWLAKPPHHRVGIPYQPKGKQLQENCAKI